MPGMGESVQDRHAPKNHCFGCGPVNDKGLRLKSYEEGDTLVARFRAEPHHEAFPGVVNGGIIGALLDCHGNWAAAMHLMRGLEHDRPPCTVTAEFAVKLLRPTPTSEEMRLVARVLESAGPRAVVDVTMEAGGKVTATCRGVFVAVGEGHPAFHRW
jgi:acyl-coenzyme A thioesterase PaaI-like protein